MKIRSITADWLHVPIPEDKQHTTDFGRIAAFDSTLVRIETAGGVASARPRPRSAAPGPTPLW
jgi:hypothetical protein